jgi:isopentenyl diphosphate isomerase/L-lactate dehydrogenase-like FMN-dependent dehydrogenase
MTAVEREFPTINAVIDAAYDRMEPEVWDYVAGGAESETTLRRNRLAFDRIALRPRRLRDARERSTETVFLGRTLSAPVLFAPVGSIGKYFADGALGPARVAERLGTGLFLSNSASPPLQAVTAATSAPVVYQLYIRGDRRWTEEQIRHAEASGCAAISLTADRSAPGHRERSVVNGYSGPRGSGAGGTDDLYQYHEGLTWQDVEWLRSLTALPLIVKGIMCGEDADLAVRCGADVVYISNHGGRSLDHLPGTSEVLPEVVEAVAGRADVIIDSGFLYGSDVLKALAYGAKAVLVGKLMVWSLAAGGEPALEGAMRMLQRDLFDLMGHLGVLRVDELGPQYLLPSFAPPASEFIGFASGFDLARRAARNGGGAGCG